jgi:hypothetical protein
MNNVSVRQRTTSPSRSLVLEGSKVEPPIKRVKRGFRAQAIPSRCAMSFERCPAWLWSARRSEFTQIWMLAKDAMRLEHEFLTTWDNFKDKIRIIEGSMATAPMVDIWLLSGSRMFLQSLIQGIPVQIPVMVWVYPIGRRHPSNIAPNVDWFTVPHSQVGGCHHDIRNVWFATSSPIQGRVRPNRSDIGACHQAFRAPHSMQPGFGL